MPFLIGVLCVIPRPSHAPQIGAAWATEVGERVAAYERGQSKASGDEEVFARLRGEFGL